MFEETFKDFKLVEKVSEETIKKYEETKMGKMNYSIDIALQIWHPALTGDQLQALFNKAPDVKHTAGEFFTRKDGKKLPAKHIDSYVCYDVVPLQDFEDLGEPLKNAAGIISNMLKVPSSLLELKKSGGRVSLYCALYSKDHIAFSVPSEIAKKISDFGIDIGLEIFENYSE